MKAVFELRCVSRRDCCYYSAIFANLQDRHQGKNKGSYMVPVRTREGESASQQSPILCLGHMVL